MTHSAKTSNRVSGSPFGPVLIGFAGAVGLALLTLATGHGLLMAFLAYSLSGRALPGRRRRRAVAGRGRRASLRTGSRRPRSPPRRRLTLRQGPAPAVGPNSRPF